MAAILRCLVPVTLGLLAAGCSSAATEGQANGGAGGSPALAAGSAGVQAAAGTLSPSASGNGGGADAEGGGATMAGAASAGATAAGTGGGGEPGAGSGSGAGSDSGGGATKLVGVFVGQGHEGRITRSCDDGLTFPYNHSADDTFRCFIDADHDCDHSENAGRGLAFGDGAFVATWGWGHPGKLQRSTDGKAWDDVMTATPTFADIAYGNSLFVACANPTRVSSDGKTWDTGGKLSFDFNYRGI
ncbi:MAG TPA: hypothetical protein VNG33_00790, partial [Polyangiaceae bacterium]|nr:hypothetical protein [Polyangiaceae bacterium]